MRAIDPVVQGDPPMVPAIVHLMQEFKGTNAEARLGYRPEVDWRPAVDAQIAEMARRQSRPVRMHKPLA